MKKILVSLVLGFVGVFAFAKTSFAATTVIYNNGLTDPLPGNVVSEGVEAYAFKELGGQIQFDGYNRLNPKVTVMMSSFACQTGSWNLGDCVTATSTKFSHPITLNVYNVGDANSVGSLIVTKTETFDMPYRPSADPDNCPDATNKWHSDTDHACYNGLAFPISFNLTGVTLPDKVIVSVAYNTSHFGYNPIGDTDCNTAPGGCFYDSLNIGLGYSLLAGSDPVLDSIYQNATNYNYCDNGARGINTFRFYMMK